MADLLQMNLLLINGIDPSHKKEIIQFYGLDSLLMERDWITLLQQTGFKGIKIRKQEQPILPTEY